MSRDPGANEDQARRLLTKAEETCLVTDSLKVRPHLESVVGIRGIVKTIIFACLRNVGHSQMAAAFFNKLADPAKARALSAGTTPGDRVHPEVVALMQEEGIDLSGAPPEADQ